MTPPKRDLATGSAEHDLYNMIIPRQLAEIGTGKPPLVVGEIE